MTQLAGPRSMAPLEVAFARPPPQDDRRSKRKKKTKKKLPNVSSSSAPRTWKSGHHSLQPLLVLVSGCGLRFDSGCTSGLFRGFPCEGRPHF